MTKNNLTETKEQYKERHKRIDEAEKIQEELSNKKPYTRKDTGELVVITRARSFSKYVLNVTRSMPKDFRFVISANMQRLALSILENLIRANHVNVQPNNTKAWQKRFDFQTQASADLQVLEYLTAYAYEEKAMLQKQFVQISKQGAEVAHFLAAWKQSDARRFAG